MSLRYAVILAAVMSFASAAHAAREYGNAAAGKRLVAASCTTCHAPAGAKRESDAVPSLVMLARDNRNDPNWTRAWLMDPHPPMEGIMLSRQQIADVIAYLNTLPTK